MTPRFCGTCGAPLDPATGLCPHCDLPRQTAPEPQPANGGTQVFSFQPEQTAPQGVGYYPDDAAPQGAAQPPQGAAQPPYPPTQGNGGGFAPPPKKKNGPLIAVLAVLLLLLLTAGTLVALQMTGTVDIPFLSFLNKEEAETKPDKETGTPAEQGIDVNGGIETYEVPDFVGKDFDTVLQDTFLTDFFDLVQMTEYSDTVPEGRIMAQDVDAHTMAARGTRIILYVSSGQQKLTMPDLTGMTFDEAAATLRSMGLAYTRETKANNGQKTAGTVAETVPAKGSAVAQNERITVLVWGEPPTTVPPTTAAPSGRQVRLEDDMRLRSGPGTNYSYSRVLYTGTTVGLLDTQGDWAHISYNGTTGWVHGPTAFPSWWSGGTADPTGSYPYNAVLKNTMRLRSGPSTSYSIKLTISVGSTVTVHDKQYNSAGELWAYITYNGYDGWVRVAEAGV